MTAPLKRRITVAIPPARAFSVFCHKVDLWWPPGHRRFAGSTLSLDPRPGGRLVETGPAGEHFLIGEVEEAEPPHRLALLWHPGRLSRPSQVEIRFAVVAGGTEVQITHRPAAGLPRAEWSDRLALFEAGWDTILPGYAAACAAD